MAEAQNVLVLVTTSILEKANWIVSNGSEPAAPSAVSLTPTTTAFESVIVEFEFHPG